MSVNPDLVNLVFEPTEPYLVGREKIREFAAAVYSTDPAHVDVGVARERGFSDVVAPPTFPVVLQDKTLQQLLAHPEAKIDFSRVVHGDQRFDYVRPIVAGDDLVAQLKVIDVKSLGGHSMVTSETAISTVSGEHVVTATSTLVVRGDDS
jgi:acyl dehydratase